MKALEVNGESKKTDAATVTDLLNELGLAGQAVAVEVNQAVVPKQQHGEATLNDGDKVELVTLVGGG
ncbi:MAG: sulfur carrier protein ThiS [Planctomycetota bacterium]